MSTQRERDEPCETCRLISISAGSPRSVTELDRLFKNHIFVGIADLQTGRSLVQHQTKLYLVKHNVVA